MTLPLADPLPHAASPVSDTVAHHAAGTVLLVEDEEAVRTIARRILQRASYRVLVARHGADALRTLAASSEKVDVLLSDVAMPEMARSSSRVSLPSAARGSGSS